MVLLEAGNRLGGKAGADFSEDHQCYIEHGYHVFPAWYPNTRQLLRELGIEGNLIDLKRSHALKPGAFPQMASFEELSSFGNVLKTLFRGERPWAETLLSYYYYVDLTCTPLRRTGLLDRISANGFLRSRFYATEGVSDFNQQRVLQASSIPVYEMSAMALQKVITLWAANPKPFLSILNGNLQERFIAPFQRDLEALGVDIRLHQSVAKLETAAGCITGLCFDDGRRLEAAGADDLFVLAIPPEAVLRLIDDDVFAAEQLHVGETDSLTGLVHLKSVPMAGFTLYLNSRVDRLPTQPTFLDGSRHHLSFIDLSQYWPELAGENTVLSVIAAHFEPLKGLSHNKMAEILIDELSEYLPIGPKDIEHWHLQENVSAPLFLNTVGSWRYRPGTRTRLPNMYITGDYCRTPVELTTMESAVMSGLRTAQAILTDYLGQPAANRVEFLPLKTFSTVALWLMKYAGLPVVVLLYILLRLNLLPQTHLQDEA
ncbi:MAG: hypothetical protein ETSY1_40695 [Candidatus Entotheonella factor]|uniref:Amine oxidase domain-containing protein n=1 Tax=Entotheonella factor TaxID=1429438 RepID=W4L4W5_ENTF1|nr:MAG: hypothetical protein ETSY1_40695 [Candidatus Entotheonella factor]